MTHRFPLLLALFAPALLLACDHTTSVTGADGPPNNLVLPSQGDPCPYLVAHDQANHTIFSSTDCLVLFDNELKHYTIHYTLTLGAEAGQREGFAVVEWRAALGATGYVVRHVQWHESSSAMGIATGVPIKFPARNAGVAITGYSFLCADNEPDPWSCWRNRAATHNDARWLVPNPNTTEDVWIQWIADDWEGILNTANDENLAPVLNRLIVMCGFETCTADASDLEDPNDLHDGICRLAHSNDEPPYELCDVILFPFLWDVELRSGVTTGAQSFDHAVDIAYGAQELTAVRVSVRDQDGIWDGSTLLFPSR